MNMLAMAVLYGSVACRSLIKRRWIGNAAMLVVATLILVITQFEPAAAQSLDTLVEGADRVVQFFLGPFGRSIGAIAFIGMFMAAAFGFWSWGALLRVAGCLAGMFAAAELVDFVAGGA